MSRKVTVRTVSVRNLNDVKVMRDEALFGFFSIRQINYNLAFILSLAKSRKN